jgi:SAM-dependent methyltransferase
VTTPVETLDEPAAEDRAAAFSQRMLGVFNDACLALMTSIGHRTGLFDTLAAQAPCTPAELAEAAGLQERYVREWLGAMVLGGVVDHDPARGTFTLPPAHAACLTRAAGPDNMATLMQYVPLLGGVEDGIVECFRRGGGLPYAAFPRFQAVQAEDSGQVMGATLLERTLPAFPAVENRLRQGADVADVGCGKGRAVNLMALAFPRSRFVGYDISCEAVAAARVEAEAWGLRNVRYEVRDAAEINDVRAFDVVTAFDAIHDQAHPRRVLRNVARALRAGGRFLMADIRASSRLHENHGHPLGVAFFTISCLHCMTVSLAAGGEGLGAMWGEQKARELLEEAGFEVHEVHQVEGDIQNLYFLAARG